jgi:hypothetical protein
MDPTKLLAQASKTYQVTGPGLAVTSGADATSKAERIISQSIGILTLVAFIFFAFQIIFAGYSFISNSGDAKSIETNRKKLTEGILGLTIVVIALGISALLATLMGIDGIFNLNGMLTQMGL